MCLLEPERRQSEEDGLADEYKKPRALSLSLPLPSRLILINIYHLSAYTALRERCLYTIKPMGQGGVASLSEVPRDDSIYPAEQTRSLLDPRQRDFLRLLSSRDHDPFSFIPPLSYSPEAYLWELCDSLYSNVNNS